MLRDDWHTCLGDAPATHATHFAIRGASWQAPSNLLQQRQAWKRRIRPGSHFKRTARLAFSQVLLEIMSQVVIFECCLRGPSGASPTAAAQRQRMHQSEGGRSDTWCTSTRQLGMPRSRYARLTCSAKFVGDFIAWLAISRIAFLSWNFEHTLIDCPAGPS